MNCINLCKLDNDCLTIETLNKIFNNYPDERIRCRKRPYTVKTTENDHLEAIVYGES